LTSLKDYPQEKYDHKTPWYEWTRRQLDRKDAWFKEFEEQEKTAELRLAVMKEKTLEQLRDKVAAYKKHMKKLLGEKETETKESE
jgi:hypothetical protein